MSETIRLVIVTDRPSRAARSLLGCAVDRLPSWIKVMDGQDIMNLPAKAPVLALFFSDASLAESLWRVRRTEVDLDDDYGKHHDRLKDWLSRRDAAERDLCREAGATFPDDIPQVSAREMENLHLCRPAPSLPPQHSTAKPSKWR